VGRIRRVLRYLRIEDEQGQLSLTTVAFLVGATCLARGAPIPPSALVVFGLAVCAYLHKRHRQQCATELAMEGAQEAAVQRMNNEHEITKVAQGAHVEEVSRKLDDLVTKVLTITSPERLQGLKDAFGRKSA
jgi:flagellar biosynthesis component FlhA